VLRTPLGEGHLALLGKARREIGGAGLHLVCVVHELKGLLWAG
jgi:hypothetical protein